MEKPPVLKEAQLKKLLGDDIIVGQRAEKSLEAQRDADLKWFVEWGEEVCPHKQMMAGGRIYRKKDCAKCWQELQKLIRVIDEV